MERVHISRFFITSLLATGSFFTALGRSPAQVPRGNPVPTRAAPASPVGNPSGVINPSVFAGSGFYGRAANFPGPQPMGNNNSTGVGSIQNSSIRGSSVQNSIAPSNIQNSSSTPGVAAPGTLPNQGAGINAIAAPGSSSPDVRALAPGGTISGPNTGAPEATIGGVGSGAPGGPLTQGASSTPAPGANLSNVSNPGQATLPGNLIPGIVNQAPGGTISGTNSVFSNAASGGAPGSPIGNPGGRSSGAPGATMGTANSIGSLNAASIGAAGNSGVAGIGTTINGQTAISTRPFVVGLLGGPITYMPDSASDGVANAYQGTSGFGGTGSGSIDIGNVPIPAPISSSWIHSSNVGQSSNSVSALEVESVQFSQPITEQTRFLSAIPLGSDGVSLSATRGLRAGVQRILSSSRLPSKNTIQVTFDGGDTVVLRGIVKDEQELRLAEAVARLTPGVRSLRNELAVPLSATNNGADR
jgi:hypothetical protein